MSERPRLAELKIGTRLPEHRRTVSQDDFDRMAVASLDHNPVHTNVEWAKRQLAVMRPVLIAVVVALLSHAASTNVLAAGPQGVASPPGTALARSWGDLHLGMTPTQFGHMCERFGFGPLKTVEPEDFLSVTYAESPVAKHCRSGCRNLKFYTCRDQDQAYGAFLKDRAILINGVIFALRPDPCASLCRGLSADDCAASAKFSACLERQVEDETEHQEPERVAAFKRLYGAPRTTGKDDTTGLEWYEWRNTHTDAVLFDGGKDIEIDDLDVERKLVPREGRASAESSQPFCDQAADLVNMFAKMRDQGVDENTALASGRATLEISAGHQLSDQQKNALAPLITRVYANPGATPTEAKAQWLSTCYAVYPTGNP